MPDESREVEAVDALPDADLALRARDGDARAFAVLMRRHDAVLRRTILWRTHNDADVDDALQETVLKVWQKLPSLREPAKVRAWILRIAAREALQLVTSRRPASELYEDSATIGGPDRLVDRFDLQEGLRSVLQQLPDQQARSWVLRELEGLSYRDIAERLAVPESSVRGSLVLARRRVQSAIDEMCPSARAATTGARGRVQQFAAPLVTPVKAPVATYPPSATGVEPRAAVVTALHEDLEVVAVPEAPGAPVPRVPAARADEAAARR